MIQQHESIFFIVFFDKCLSLSHRCDVFARHTFDKYPYIAFVCHGGTCSVHAYRGSALMDINNFEQIYVNPPHRWCVGALKNFESHLRGIRKN